MVLNFAMIVKYQRKMNGAYLHCLSHNAGYSGGLGTARPGAENICGAPTPGKKSVPNIIFCVL